MGLLLKVLSYLAWLEVEWETLSINFNHQGVLTLLNNNRTPYVLFFYCTCIHYKKNLILV